MAVQERILTASEYFSPMREENTNAFIDEAVAIERAARVQKHAFFQVARDDRQALIFWAGQEAVITNPFSQILFKVMANIKNVHIRSMLLPVVAGEHGVMREGIAHNSHPWLLWELCLSIGIDPYKIVITEAVARFMTVLEAVSNNPMRALGVLGIGNEMMLIEEYRAIEACFDRHFPEGPHRAFLHANISEDFAHTRLICQAASALGQLGYSDDDFINGAREGVTARIAYYDMLLHEFRLG